MNILAPQDWTFPVPIAYGPGRLKEIGSFCARAGMMRPLVVTDRGSADLPFIGELARHLASEGISFALYSEISPNPRDEEIAAGRNAYRTGGHDGIIAIGGGSGMDGGKAICLVANNDLDLWSFEFEQAPPDMASQNAFPPLICIPTTAGTGAETESTAMITDVVRGMKFCIWHPELKPSFALLDPEITVALPANLTAWTGVDALVHAIEAYCVPSFHPLCDGVALEGLRLVSKWLLIAVKEPGNLEARGGLLAGSCLAGVAFLKGLGLVHAISHMVGAEYDTHHGLTNAVLLPSVLRYNEPALSEKIRPMAEAMALTDTSFDGFYAGICALLDAVDIPVKLADLGVAADRVPQISAKAMQDVATSTNPRRPTVECVENIIATALTNGR